MISMPKTDFIEMQEEYLDNVLEIYTHYVLNTSATFHSRALDCSAMREIVFFDSEKYKYIEKTKTLNLFNFIKSTLCL